MLRTVLIASLLLASGSAFAAQSSPHCGTIADAKAGAPAGAKFTVMAPGQVNFLRGFYVASPVTPGDGLPPGDGALLMEIENHSMVIWTRGNKEACITPILTNPEKHEGTYMPMPLNPQILALLKRIKSGKDEAVMGGQPDPGELKL